MTPPGEPRFALFDALRGLAVVAVVAFHVASLTGSLGLGADGRVIEALGPLAVAVFFVLSGFLLYRPFAAARAAGRPGPSLRRYGRRRVTRILPALWVALAVLAVFPGIVFGGGAWRHVALLSLYDPQARATGIPVAWTLCVEATFYLALPLWVLALRRARPRTDLLALGAVAAVGVVLQLAAATERIDDLWADALPGQATWFALGMALAVASATALREPAWVARRPGAMWLVAAAAIAGLAALVPPGGLAGVVVSVSTAQPAGEALARIALTAIAAAALLAPAVFGQDRGGLPRRVLAWAPVAWIGTVSYSLYLWHLPIAQLLALDADPAHFSASGLGLRDRLDVAPTPVLLVLTLAVSAAIAAVSFRWVERPFLRR